MEVISGDDHVFCRLEVDRLTPTTTGRSCRRWSRSGTGGTPGRLGRRCCHHRRHFHHRMRFTRQFQTFNNEKEERGVEVMQSGIERAIDIKELLVGDIALLEPG